MRYIEFRFKNFKGIENMTLTLPESVTTLIGLNESGKTTILEALFCFSYGAEDLDAINPELASLRAPDQWIPISKRANFNDTIEIGAEVELGDDDRDALSDYMRKRFDLTLTDVPSTVGISERHLFENSRFVKTEFLWTFPVRGTKGRQRSPRPYGGRTREWQDATTFLQHRLPRIWYFPNFLFELPERFSLTDQEPAEDEEHDRDRFYRSTFEQILQQIGTGASLDTHLIERLNSAERADQRSLRALLLAMSNVVTTTIYEGWDRIFGRRPTAQEIQIDAADGEDGPYLELKIKGPDGYYDLSERSLGFRWFFMFLLMTSFHEQSDDSSHALFLLDEPASNLHSTAQAELLKSFHSLVEKCDLIYATHSHHLIDVRWLDGAYIVKNAALGDLDMKEYMTQRLGANTSISAAPYRRFVSEHPNQTSYFQPVLDLLDYRPSAIEPIPDVVLVEGKGDFFLLQYAAEVLNLGPELRLIPGGGAGSLDPLIRLHIGWGKSFVILLDSDMEGRTQRERYVREFGPLIADRCFLLADLCGDSDVRAAEDLLTEKDREVITSTISYDEATPPAPKKALRNAVLELYARREMVKLGTRSRARLRSLLGRLSQELIQQKV